MVLRRPERVLRVLAELRPLGAIGPVTLDEVRDVLADELATVAERPPAARYGRVFVGTVEQARGRGFDVVFLPGPGRARLPAEAARGSDPARRAPARARRRARDAGRPRPSTSACCCAWPSARPRARLYLSYSRIELAEARPRVPSFYAMEVAARARRARCPTRRRSSARRPRRRAARLAWPAPDDPARAIDEVEHDLASLGASLRPAGEARGPRPLSARAERPPRALAPHAVGALAAGSSRPHDGLVRVARRHARDAGRLAARRARLLRLRAPAASPRARTSSTSPRSAGWRRARRSRRSSGSIR